MRILLATFILMTIAAKPAFAYIDASLGALILQGLVAGFISAAVIWRSWVYKVKAFFKKVFKSDTAETSQANAEK